MRYVIYGAGAVGGTIGGRLFEHGHDVLLIARGAHLAALQRDGLRFIRPEGEAILPIPAVGSPAEAELGAGDVVIMAMKTQHTAVALEALAAAAPVTVPIVCAQNGVENERLALRRFEQVYAVVTMLPAMHLEPGVVTSHGTPVSGILDLGRYPVGLDDLGRQIAADLEASGFSARAETEIMPRKYAKILANVGNALDALSGRAGRKHELMTRARDEARAVFAAAGIAVISDEDERTRREGVLQSTKAGGTSQLGSSSWQSLARGADSIEVDFLNGEVVLLGRMHGVPTPVNQLLQEAAHRAVREGAEAGSVPVEELAARLSAQEEGLSTPLT